MALGTVAAAVTLAACDRDCEGWESLSEVGADNRRWLPEHLPADASYLRECHDAPSGTVRGTFRFTPQSANALRGSLKKLSAAEANARPLAGPRTNWWPRQLEGDLSDVAGGHAGYELFRAKLGSGKEILVAVQWPASRAFYSTVQ